jgi:hypothetical protein
MSEMIREHETDCREEVRGEAQNLFVGSTS